MEKFTENELTEIEITLMEKFIELKKTSMELTNEDLEKRIVMYRNIIEKLENIKKENE